MGKAEPHSSGVYGLFRLDGAPIRLGDAHALGMDMPDRTANWLIAGYDPQAPTAVHRHSDADGDTLLVGEVHNVADIAARLGLARTTPTGRIAQAALARFGSDTPAEMLGEWSLLHRAADGRLTLMTGAARRDRLHYAVVGAHVAVAPDLFLLARIAWVGTELDEAGLLFPMGRERVRSGAGDGTMLARVRQVHAGCSVVIDRGGRISQSCASVLVQPPPWRGTFAEALAQSEDLLRQIMRERLAGTAQPALLLSGGLDSSLLAWLAAEERGSDQTISCLTSAAPSASGISDETGFAGIVAGHLGLRCDPVVADDAANFYRPPDAVLGGSSGPLLSNRHCLTEAFQIAAKATGATLLVNGSYGEMTATARLPETGLARRLRAFAAPAYHGLRNPSFRTPVSNPFHVRIAPHRLANLPEPIVATLAQSADPVPTSLNRTGLLGYMPGVAKSLAQSNAFYPGAVRMDFPFRDMRLFRLFASFPVAMLLKGGSDRPVARAMLQGRLPDAIRLRRSGMPAEPDRFYRMRRQALAAHARISAFRKADVGDWIDLDWLDAALLRVAANGAANNDETNEVQLTAIAAEFLFWWRSRS